MCNSVPDPQRNAKSLDLPLKKWAFAQRACCRRQRSAYVPKHAYHYKGNTNCGTGAGGFGGLLYGIATFDQQSFTAAYPPRIQQAGRGACQWHQQPRGRGRQRLRQRPSKLVVRWVINGVGVSDTARRPELAPVDRLRLRQPSCVELSPAAASQQSLLVSKPVSNHLLAGRQRPRGDCNLAVSCVCSPTARRCSGFLGR